LPYGEKTELKNHRHGDCLDTKAAGGYLYYDSVCNSSDSEVVSKVVKSSQSDGKILPVAGVNRSFPEKT
jgi:hypothetical protein